MKATKVNKYANIIDQGWDAVQAIMYRVIVIIFQYLFLLIKTEKRKMHRIIFKRVKKAKERNKNILGIYLQTDINKWKLLFVAVIPYIKILRKF